MAGGLYKDALLLGAAALGACNPRQAEMHRTLEFAFFVALWPSSRLEDSVGLLSSERPHTNLLELPVFWIILTLGLRSKLTSDRGIGMLVNALLACVVRRLFSRLANILPNRLRATLRLVVAIGWGSRIARQIEDAWSRADNEEQYKQAETGQGREGHIRRQFADTSIASCSPVAVMHEKEKACEHLSISTPPNLTIKLASPKLVSTMQDTTASSPIPEFRGLASNEGPDASSDYAEMDRSIEEACSNAVQLLMSYADADDFVLQKTFPTFGNVEIAKKDLRNYSLPVVRGRLTVDTSLFQGDPMALWNILSRFAAVFLSHSCRVLYDENYNDAELLRETASTYAHWFGQRRTANGTAYDYVVANKLFVGDGRITVSQSSLPANLVPGGVIAKPGYIRNWLYVAGLDVSQVRKTQEGILLRVTYVVHSDAPGLTRATLGSFNGAEGPLINTPLGILTRIMDLITADLCPERISLSPDTTCDLLPLRTNDGKTIFVPAFVHAAMSTRLGRKSWGSAHKTIPAALEYSECQDVASCPEAEAVAEEALQRFKDVLDSDVGWELQDVPVPGISTSIRNVVGSKWLMYKAEMTIELPERFNGSLCAAIAECALLYASHTVSRLTDCKYDKSVIVSKHNNCEIEWRAMMPTVSSDPVDFVLARGYEIVTSDRFEMTVASSSLPQDMASEVVPEVPKEAAASFGQPPVFNRSRLGLHGFRVRGIPATETCAQPSLKFSLLLNPVLIGTRAPEFLIRKELLLMPSSRLYNWREIFVAGLVPEVIEHGGGCSGIRPPEIKDAVVTAHVAGVSHRIDAWFGSILREVCDEGLAEDSASSQCID